MRAEGRAPAERTLTRDIHESCTHSPHSFSSLLYVAIRRARRVKPDEAAAREGSRSSRARRKLIGRCLRCGVGRHEGYPESEIGVRLLLRIAAPAAAAV